MGGYFISSMTISKVSIFPIAYFFASLYKILIVTDEQRNKFTKIDIDPNRPKICPHNN